MPHLFLLIIIFIGSFSAYADELDTSLETYSVAYAEDSYPYYFTKNGKARGIMVDIWKLWAKNQQVDIEFVSMNYQQAIVEISQGNIDFHAGVADSDERRKSLSFGSQILKIDSYFYLPYHMDTVTDVDDFNPYTLGVVQGSIEQDYIRENLPELAVRTFVDKVEMYQAALDGEVLVYLDDNEGDRLNPNYNLVRKQYPLSKRFLLFERYIGGATAKGNEQLLKMLNTGMDNIDKDKLQAIVSKWQKYPTSSNAITIGYSPNKAPYMAQDVKGEAQGIFIDYWRKWAELNKQEVEFIPINRDEVLQLVKEQFVDVHAGIPFIDLKYDNFNRQHFIHSAIAQIYVSKKNALINETADLNGLKLGIYIDSPYRVTIKERYPNIELIEFLDVESMIKAELNGEVSAFLGTVEVVESQTRKDNLTSNYKRLLSPRYEVKFYSISNSSDQTLIKTFENTEIPSAAEKQAIINSWLQYDQSMIANTADYMADLSSAQLQFLSTKSTFTVGILDAYKPMEFADGDKAKGIDIDILSLISVRTGIDFNYVFYADWSVLFADFKNDKIDLTMGMTPSQKRLETMRFSKEYISIPWGIIGRPNLSAEIDDADSLSGYNVAILEGYKAIEYLQQNHPLINLIIVNSIKQGAELLQSGEADLYIDFHPVLPNMILDFEINSFDIRYLSDIPPELNHIAVNYKYEQLPAILNQGINNITASDMDNIRDYWMRAIIKEGFDKDTVIRNSVFILAVVLVIISTILFWLKNAKKEINKRLILEEKLRHTASHDLLTGLANRGLFSELLEKAIQLHKRQQQMLAVCFIDIDGFKAVNDNYGHGVGDKLLIKIGEMLIENVRDSDVVCRYGGDEFLILLNNIDNKEGAGVAARKIIDSFDTTIDIDGNPVNIGSSIGISLYPSDDEVAESLIKRADALMYQIKAKGKNNFMFSE
ncbi:transporter substrate-binding domain-containing protein [Colwelliaceae bacterium BS250]